MEGRLWLLLDKEKKKIGAGPGLQEKRQFVFLASQALWKSRHFVYVRALIMRKILRSTGCAMQYWGITLNDLICLETLGELFTYRVGIS